MFYPTRRQDELAYLDAPEPWIFRTLPAKLDWAMIETLTAIFVVLSLLALALIILLIYLFVAGGTSSGECPNCGGSGRTVIHNRAGLMQMRCPTCHR